MRPDLSFIWSSAFLENKYDTTSEKPFLAANISGDWFKLSTLSTKSGSSRNRRSTLPRTPLLAAICIGSCPFSSLEMEEVCLQARFSFKTSKVGKTNTNS